MRCGWLVGPLRASDLEAYVRQGRLHCSIHCGMLYLVSARAITSSLCPVPLSSLRPPFLDEALSLSLCALQAAPDTLQGRLPLVLHHHHPVLPYRTALIPGRLCVARAGTVPSHRLSTRRPGLGCASSISRHASRVSQLLLEGSQGLVVLTFLDLCPLCPIPAFTRLARSPPSPVSIPSLGLAIECAGLFRDCFV